jgi:hypothetical protein
MPSAKQNELPHRSVRAIAVPIRHFALWLLVLICSGSMFLYWRRVTSSVRASSAAPSVMKPKALTDFYPSWYATREFLLHHRDPYGAEVNRELQIAFYGKELDWSRPEERKDQQRFVYPLYFIFFVAPTIWMPFDTVRTVFWWVLATCAALNVALWLRFLRIRLSVAALAALFALVLTSIPVSQNLSILQPLLLPACFLAGAAVAVASGRLFVAGMLLAVATAKPQICLLPAAWFALWVCSDWKRRRSLFWGFTITLSALVLASECLLPGWLVRYPGILRAYAEYTKTTSFLGLLLPPLLQWPLTILELATAADFCWRARRHGADTPAFALALSFMLTLTVSLIPAVIQPFNHVLLLPVVLLAIRYWQKLWQGSIMMRAAISVFCLCAVLSPMLAVVAVARPLTPHTAWFQRMWPLPLAASMAVPFAAFGFLVLLRKVVPYHPTSTGGDDGSLDFTATAKGRTIA